jgi:hypothetical protein
MEKANALSREERAVLLQLLKKLGKGCDQNGISSSKSSLPPAGVGADD